MFMGDQAGASIASGGQYNLAIGQNAGDAITTADEIVAIGYNAGSAASTNGGSVFIGTEAGRSSNGLEVVAIGSYAGGGPGGFGAYNVAVGQRAMQEAGAISIGNTAIGRTAMQLQGDNNQNNVAIGRSAGRGVFGTTIASNNNVFVGAFAAGNITTGDDNTVIGSSSGNVLAAGNNNTFVGRLTGATTTDGSNNIIIGYDIDASSALSSNELNIGDTIFGNLTNDQIGIGVADATAINADAILELDSTSRGLLLPRMTTVQRDAISGGSPTDSGLTIYNTTTNTTDYWNGSAWVSFATSGGTVSELDDLSDAATTIADNNMFIGHTGGSYGANDNNNLGIGYGTLDSLINSGAANTGDLNTAVGHDAMTANTTGDQNVAVGTAALSSNVAGRRNTAIGRNALQDSIGDDNAALGRSTLGQVTGDQNTGLGTYAGRGVGASSDVSNNVFIGYSAGGGALTGADNNTIIGHNAAATLTTGASNIIIGKDADVSAATASNELNIGNQIFGDLTNGFLAVNTPADDRILHLHDPDTGVWSTGDLQLTSNGSGSAIGDGVRLGYTDGNGTPYGFFTVAENAPLRFDTNSIERMRIEADGDIGIGTNAPDASSILDITSTTRGFLTPRMTTVQRDAINSGTFATGLMIYNTTTNLLEFYDGSSWVSLGGAPTAPGNDTEVVFNNAGALDAEAGMTYSASTDTLTLGTALEVGDYINIAGQAGSAPTFAALNDLSNVNTTPSNGDALVYNNTSGEWEAGSVNASSAAQLADDDNDTLVQVEEGGAGADDDTIRFDAAGSQILTITNSLITAEEAIIIRGSNGSGTSNTLGLTNNSTTSGSQTGITFRSGSGVGSYQASINHTRESANDASLSFTTISGGVAGTRLRLDGNGNVGVGTLAANDASAKLQIDTTTQGFLAPRMADPSSTIASPATGLMAYNTTSNTYDYYDGTSWTSFATSAGSTSKAEDADGDTWVRTETDANADNDTLRFAAGGSVEHMRITSAGNVGIGTTTPGNELEVSGDIRTDSVILNGVAGDAPTYVTQSGLDWDDFNDTMTLDATTTIDMDTNSADFNFDSDTFYVDSSANAIGIGTNAPAHKLDIEQNVNGHRYVRFSNNTNASSAAASFRATTSAGNLSLGINATAHSTKAGRSEIEATGSGGLYIASDNATGSIVFQTGSGPTTRMSINEAGRIAIGTGTPDASAVLDISSTTLGFLPPRMTTVQRDAINSGTFATGLTVFNTTTNTLQYYDGSAWQNASASGGLAINDLSDGIADASNLMLGSGKTSTYDVQNTVVGVDAFASNSAASQANTVMGWEAMNSGTGEADYNTVIGRRSGSSLSAAEHNTFIGYDSGRAMGNGDNNVFIGSLTGDGMTDGTNNIFIGYNVDGSTTTVSNELNIGNTIYGDLSNDYVGIGNTSPDVELDVTGDIEYSGTLTDVSDRRLKTDINPLDTDAMINKLTAIDTYTFKMIDDETGRTEYGVMAQEIEKIFPELVKTANDEMGTKSVNYMGLIAPMIEATKSLKAENNELRAELASLKSGQDEMQATLASLTDQVELLNKAAVNDVNKASILPVTQSWLYLLLGILGTLCIVLVTTRKSAKAK